MLYITIYIYLQYFSNINHKRCLDVILSVDGTSIYVCTNVKRNLAQHHYSAELCAELRSIEMVSHKIYAHFPHE